VGPDYPGRWVLLVERDAASLVAETRLLATFGLRIEMAADFEEAQETLGEESGCALILLAERVSPENTCDTIKAFRAWATAAHLPLVVIGRAGSPEAHGSYLAAGADDLIAKPMTTARLAAVLSATLGPAEPRNPQKTA
jgi:DNA-binding response OmpR family regulator